MSKIVSTIFPSVPPSAASARRFVGAALRRWGCSDQIVELALLLTSELVTNAYRHVGSEARVSVTLRNGIIRVEVGDDGVGDVRLQPLHPERPGGRGLQVVDALADRWGAEVREGGAVVWFELAGPVT